MSQISLMPSEFKMKAAKKRKQTYFTVIAMFSITVLLIGYIMLSLINSFYSETLDSLENKKKKLENDVKVYEKYQDIYNSVKDYEQLTEEVKSDTINWDILLNVFAKTISQGMWFDNINLNYDGKDGSCFIRGRATQNTIIIKWLADVEKTGILKDISYKYMVNVEGINKPDIAFEISAGVDIESIKTYKGME